MSIVKALPSIALFLSCTAPDDPETKKASFDLKEACKDGGLRWSPEPPPSRWDAYLVQDSLRTKVELKYDNGFWFPCESTNRGTLEVFYQ